MATDDNLFDTFNQGEYDKAISAGYTLYADAIKNPYTVSVDHQGEGSLTADGTTAQPGQTVRVNIASGTLQFVVVYKKNAETISIIGNPTEGYTFTMPASNVYVTGYFNLWYPEGTGEVNDPYLINSAADWANFAKTVANGDDFNGKYVKLTSDIGITYPVGMFDEYYSCPFSGTFLGDGHTVTAAISGENFSGIKGIAPFSYIKNATIKDLKVGGAINSITDYAAGLVGYASGTNTTENCIVSATLNVGETCYYAGGILGHGMNSNTTIKGCAFAGHINGKTNPDGYDYYTRVVGGIWGWSTEGVPTLKDCLEAGTYTNDNLMHPIGMQGKSYYTSSEDITITNCYYKNSQVGAIDNADTFSGASQVYAITATAPVTIDDISGLGTATAYGSNGITAYEKGIMYDGTCYVGSGETVTLTLSHGSKTGYTFNEYTATGGTLSGNTLTMPAQDVTISAAWTKNTHNLVDGGDNTAFITTHDGDIYDITLAGRTLYKDGKWNTLCLPFNVTLEDSPLDGATARPLASASINGSMLSLTFGTAVDELVAGTPYIIKWAAGDENITSPVFCGVTIDKTDRSYDTDDHHDVQTDERVRFLGTYASQSFDKENRSILFMGEENTLYYPLDGASIDAQRAYFKIAAPAGWQPYQRTIRRPRHTLDRGRRLRLRRRQQRTRPLKPHDHRPSGVRKAGRSCSGISPGGHNESKNNGITIKKKNDKNYAMDARRHPRNQRRKCADIVRQR